MGARSDTTDSPIAHGPSQEISITHTKRATSLTMLQRTATRTNNQKLNTRESSPATKRGGDLLLSAHDIQVSAHRQTNLRPRVTMEVPRSLLSWEKRGSTLAKVPGTIYVNIPIRVFTASHYVLYLMEYPRGWKRICKRPVNTPVKEEIMLSSAQFFVCCWKR